MDDHLSNRQVVDIQVLFHRLFHGKRKYRGGGNFNEKSVIMACSFDYKIASKWKVRFLSPSSSSFTLVKPKNGKLILV